MAGIVVDQSVGMEDWTGTKDEEGLGDETELLVDAAQSEPTVGDDICLNVLEQGSDSF